MNRITKSFTWAYVLVFLLTVKFVEARTYSTGGFVGYNDGPGFQIYGAISNLAQGFPLKIRFGLGHSTMDPGSPEDARQIFINDATNGTPEEKGWIWDLQLDFLYRVNWFSWQRTYILLGPREAYFTGNFKFVGGNEDFDVRSKQWGWGIGFEKYYKVSEKMDLVLTTGVDYFSKNILNGHDTSYSPNGEIVNGRNDYTFKDADKAINQPELVPKFMLGMTYHFTK